MLRENFADRRSAVTDRHRAADFVIDERLVVDAQCLINRGADVRSADRIGSRVCRLGVTGTINRSALNPRPGEQHRVAKRPVIAPRVCIDLWRASKVAHHDHQCFIEQSAVRKILHERVIDGIQVREIVALQQLEVL